MSKPRQQKKLCKIAAPAAAPAAVAAAAPTAAPTAAAPPAPTQAAPVPVADTPMLIDATSCSGWDCNIEGQFCPKGVPGASTGNFLCQDKKWMQVDSRPTSPAAPPAAALAAALVAAPAAPPVAAPAAADQSLCVGKGGITSKYNYQDLNNPGCCDGKQPYSTRDGQKWCRVLVKSQDPRTLQPAPQAAATDEAKVADAATQASQMHLDAQIATNEPTISPGASIGTWGGNNDSGVPQDSVASQAASSNLATQQIIPGSAYPSNTTVANVSGVYPNQASLNNIQGGNAQQTMTGVNTDMAPSPLAPTSSESSF